MALTFLGLKSDPVYLALSSDIGLDDKIIGANVVGAKIFLTDTKLWKIILLDLTLQDFAMAIEATLSGDVEIGAVEIKNSTDDTRATVDGDGLWVRSVIKDIDQPLDAARNLTPYYNEQDVASSGTAEPLLPSATYASMILVWAKGTNVGSICFGTSAVDKTSSRQIVLPAGSMASIDVPLGYRVGVHQFYVDADNSGDGVQFFYMR